MGINCWQCGKLFTPTRLRAVMTKDRNVVVVCSAECLKVLREEELTLKNFKGEEE